jgi:hypothetical protein
MFEEMDINDMLRKGKKPKKGDDDSGEPRKQPNRFNNGGNQPPFSEEELAKTLEEKFGMHAEVVRGGIIMQGSGGGKDARLKHEGVLESLIYVAQAAKIPPSCKDANGAELQAGDILKVPGGETKTVLKVGWKFVVLSRTEDQTASDGAWFENQINELNFIKKVN